MKKQIFSLTVAAFTMILGGISTSAVAAVSEKYPGTMCHGYRTADANNLRHGYNGEIMNNGTGGSTLDCPLVRKTGTGLSSAFTNLEMIVSDKSTLGNISCTQMNRSALGTLGSWASRSTSGVDPYSWGQILNFGAERFVYAGYSYFRCYFPSTASGQYVQIKDYIINY